MKHNDNHEQVMELRPKVKSAELLAVPSCGPAWTRHGSVGLRHAIGRADACRHPSVPGEWHPGSPNRMSEAEAEIVIARAITAHEMRRP